MPSDAVALDQLSTDPRVPETRPLSKLRRGETAHIHGLELPAAQVHRLAGLGLCEGRVVEVVSTGDPMIVRACGSTLALGRAAARGVAMCVCDADTCPTKGEA